MNLRALRGTAGVPVKETTDEQPPIIKQSGIVAFAIIALLVISVVTVLYVARAFFLPVVMAFVVGTMLSPTAGFLERYRIPRSISAVLIVTVAFGLVSFILSLITAPLLQWLTRIPELGALL